MRIHTVMSLDPIKSIFHEKQEGSLCAQHCLNALLQGQYFTAVDLADLARQLDDSERQHMAEAGEHSAEYQTFLKQPSNNFDDSGFFSIQVIHNALAVWNLELLNYNSPDPVARTAREDPTSQPAYICNFREHWFTVRKLGRQWFNLNSLLIEPELISDTYLSMFLAQLQREGYSIFVVMGQLNECEADQLLKLVPAVQKVKPKLITESDKSQSQTSPVAGSSGSFQDVDIRKALEESRRYHEEDDSSLKEALAMSLKGLPPDWSLGSEMTWGEGYPTQGGKRNPSSETETTDPEAVRRKRLEFFGKPSSSTPETGSATETAASHGASDKDPSATGLTDTTGTARQAKESDEDEDLQKAICLSLT